ncbi:hypothetical protein PC129_g12113 [Phytophthora cactorum]|uniref:Selenoprotein SelK/SelG n=1 Tax=Phytophthora cactorum TaxID=29920 RepID=A0A329S4D4_9STRA|nr:hypothetical protein Pcac1_g7412 [Phytophthora cactorum]KAG2818332.1 hypothetical protein PC111_g12340 [Phytophthora cactorum]KAG2824649.1 hypothetical protein PC112_g10011 [Phytophthora cactorum]KAG2858254.1 hypothetical protein PC113_g9967 [Phytophthora cactorum]KAG2906826.1 hypothetical protein PC114_g11005 [Phytophthora cactorum]
MTYVSGGDVVAKRSPWRLSIVTDMFWGVINFVGLFVTTIFSDPSTATRPNSNIGQGSTSSRGLGGNGRGGPRRMGGVNHRGTINQPMGGGCCG